MVAKVTLSMPDAPLEKLRKQARDRGKSLSAYVVERLQGRGPQRRWPAGFSSLYGAWNRSVSIPDDPPPGEPEPLR